MVKIKTGVKPKILVILAAVANASQALDHDVVVTSGNDSTHMTGSKHYRYEALDIRSKNFPSAKAKREFIRAVQKRLGPSYQIILESEGRMNEHIHIEYDA